MNSLHLIDLNDFSLDDWERIINLATKIRKDPKKFYGVCAGKILATLFYEPSTRTQMSFQTAMLRLGGQVIGFDNPSTTSVSKGESLKDTIKIFSGYADLIAARSPKEGFAKAAALYSKCPLINAGDGGHLHPTQTLTDLVTLMEEKGKLTGLTIGLCGDLKNGRTVHSLIKAMSNFETTFILISTPELTIPKYLKEIIDKSGSNYREINKLEEAISLLDILYMTRIQRERFASAEEYARQKNVYVLDKAKMMRAKPYLRVLHPLPRIDEIAIDVDNDPRAVYFDQAVYGVYARMALIMTMLEDNSPRLNTAAREHEGVACENPRCITNQELYLPKKFIKSDDMLKCEYCEEGILIES